MVYKSIRCRGTTLSLFGITNKDLDYANLKLKKQAKFLDQQVSTQSGQVKTYRDFSFSANHSKRYYAELLNKIETLDAINADNVPIFLTITLDGFFRDLQRGDYSRYTKEIEEKYLFHIPSNSHIHADISQKMRNKEPLTVKDCYNILQYQLRRFLRCNAMQQLKEEGYRYSYLRVAEPHGDGTPHFHVLLYVPAHIVSALHSSYSSYFPAPQNHRPLTYRSNGRTSSILSTGQRETQGFQFEIKSARAYILKYVLKSFRNISQGKDLDYLQAWYIHNRIPRIITSHSLIPSWVYRKIAILDPSWYYHSSHAYLSTWNAEKRDENGCIVRFASFHLRDTEGREFIYQNGILELRNKGFLVSTIGEKRVYRGSGVIRKLEIKRLLDNRYTLIDLELEGKIYKISSNDFLIKREVKPVSSISLQKSIELYYNFDFDKYDPKYFGNIKNYLIDIGYLSEEKISLNDYNDSFFIP